LNFLRVFRHDSRINSRSDWCRQAQLGAVVQAGYGEVLRQYGLAGRLIQTRAVASNDNGSRGAVASRSRLGGLLNFYFRAAA